MKLMMNMRTPKNNFEIGWFFTLQHKTQGDERLKLGTSKERVRLLKMGIECKTIEELYIQYNGLKIIEHPVLFDFIETPLGDCTNSPEIPVIELRKTGQRNDEEMITSGIIADIS